MAWNINPKTNNGYPYSAALSELYTEPWVKGYPIPQFTWSVDGKHNNGYPFLWWYIKAQTDFGTATPDEIPQPPEAGAIGKYAPQYNLGDSDTHRLKDDGGKIKTHDPQTGKMLAVASNVYVMTAGQVAQLRDWVAHFATNSLIDSAIFQKVFGGNINDAVVSCKLYPLNIRKSQTGAPVTTMLLDTGIRAATPLSLTQVLDFGTVDLGLDKYYDFTNTTYNIYLPFAGVFTFQPLSRKPFSLEACVDLVAGSIQYIFTQGNHMLLTASGNIGVEVPINTQQGQLLGNAYASLASTTVSLVSAAVTAGSVAAPGAMAGFAAQHKVAEETSAMIGNATGKALATEGAFIGSEGQMLAAGKTPIIKAQLPGGAGSNFLQENPRIFWSQNKKVNDWKNVKGTQGGRSEKWVDHLSECKGLIKVKNYIPDANSATTAERNELIELMQSGVYIYT